MSASDSAFTASPARIFATTRWSLVLEAGGGADTGDAAREALSALCRAYWYPLYAFVRRTGKSAHDSQDLTQEFFTRLVEKEWLTGVAAERGRFRSWLLAAMKHFLAKEWRDAHRGKRGGGATFAPLETCDAEDRYTHEPAEALTPDQIYDRRWALDLLERGLSRLQAESRRAGNETHFEALKFCLTGEKVALREVADRLGSTEGAIKVAAHRLRERYRQVIREEIAETVDSPERVDAELHELQAALRG